MQVLLTNPEIDELTYYLAAWTKKTLKECKQKSHKYYHLKRGRVTRRRFASLLRKQPVDLVLLCGHGEYNRVYGEEEVILDKENVDLLNDKVVHALSCASAKELGKCAIQNGAKAYIGYDEDFIVFMDNANNMAKPLNDSTAALFLDAAFAAPKALLSGKTPKVAVESARKEYDSSIRKALSSDVQSDDDQFINWLYWDRDNLKLCE